MNYTLPQLLKALIDQNASDLHLSIESPPRLRIDGHLVPLQLPSLTADESQQLCYSVLTDEQKKEFEHSKEIDLAFSVKGLARFRANIFLHKGCVGGAFRVIPFKLFSLHDLGLPAVVNKFCAYPRGLILVTGPTGSGKSTTLASMINHINETRHDHIVTIEDPIEFVHEHKNCMIHQREVGNDTLGFSQALKSVLRQDPDVILVGEMRDLETVSAAITAAETGHLVFATLHTNSCIASLNRIIDVFPPHQQLQVRTQLAFSLVGVMSQLLLPSPNGGRVLALEILVPNNGIRALIRENKIEQIYSSMQSGQDESGMQTMNQSLFSLVERRLIDRASAINRSPDRNELDAMFEKAGLASKKPNVTVGQPIRGRR